MSVESSLNRVFRLLHGQQEQLATLTARHASLRDEHEALRECLADTGTLLEERWMATLHRRRFEATLRRYPCASHESLETMAQAKELILTVAARMGLRGVAAFRVASRSARAGIASVANELISLFPVTLYAVGGEAGGATLSSVERFDPHRGSWVQSEPLRTPRSGCAAVVVGGRLYVIGGSSAHGEDLSAVDRFDPECEAWECLRPLRAGRDELAAATAHGQIYAIGGSQLVWPVRHVVDAVECFTPCTGEWQALPPLSRERCAAAAVTLEGRICVLGGCNEDGTSLDTAERLDTSLGRWEPLPSMRQPRCNFAAAAVCGCIYAAGGYDDRMRDLDAVERFSPRSLMWETVSTLAVPRWGARAVGRNGTVYIVGGQARDEEVGAVDRLDVGFGGWASLGPLQTPRRSFGLAAVSGW
eukprot:gnl/TRDRNA2_/TRDRNA2_101385_c0_seq1.p1 gnl/TRDRNA2_/TRDRNA2_101385_c0~~gnl/TRDRNA2_/TRDRNA2_101385_c0_seq1.p1  ORF type:complete len:417 (+),score=56.88 gnl/TRDRNA2_/TRDRNA2_101385_c0_seq1:123-1373(+)